jgi:hypothetical protein
MDGNFDNWREQLIGARVVEDTHTGTRSTGDLGHSAEIVRKLNEQAPGCSRDTLLRELNRETYTAEVLAVQAQRCSATRRAFHRDGFSRRGREGSG